MSHKIGKTVPIEEEQVRSWQAGRHSTFSFPTMPPDGLIPKEIGSMETGAGMLASLKIYQDNRI